MKIETVAENLLLFDNQEEIFSFYEYGDRLNRVLIRFDLLDKSAFNVEFKSPLTIEISKHGFYFGNPNNMFYVPCHCYKNKNKELRELDNYLIDVRYCDAKHNRQLDHITVECEVIGELQEEIPDIFKTDIE